MDRLLWCVVPCDIPGVIGTLSPPITNACASRPRLFHLASGAILSLIRRAMERHFRSLLASLSLSRSLSLSLSLLFVSACHKSAVI